MTSAEMRLRRLLDSPESPEDLLERVEASWDLSGSFPVPKFDPVCPACRSSGAIVRMARFFKKGNAGATLRYRCDMGFKCSWCSNTWTFGIAIPRKLYFVHGRKSYTRKMILKWLDNGSRS